MKKQNKKAFTLVELLVVIAILAILATVSIVGYSAFTKKAKQSNADVEARQLYDIILANTVAPVDFNGGTDKDSYTISFNNNLVVVRTTNVSGNDFALDAFKKVVGEDALVKGAKYGLLANEIFAEGTNTFTFTKVLYVASNGFATEINLADGSITSKGELSSENVSVKKNGSTVVIPTLGGYLVGVGKAN